MIESESVQNRITDSADRGRLLQIVVILHESALLDHVVVQILVLVVAELGGLLTRSRNRALVIRRIVGEFLPSVGLLGFLDRGNQRVDGFLRGALLGEDAAPRTHHGVDAVLNGALEVRRDAHAVLAQRQNRHDVTGLNQTGDVIPAADIQVAVAANQRGVRVGTGRIRDLQQVKAFGRLREGRAVNAGRGQHRNGNLKRMILDVSLELRPVAHAELLHRDLGSNDGVDGVNQNVFALELGLEVHRGVAQHVLNIQGLGAEHKGDLLQYLGDLHKHEEGEAFTTTTKDIRSFSPSCSRGDRTRFFLKVQDGCDYFCSYCTIPFARGRSRNGTIASMVEQAEQAAAEGGKEIVLTGVNIGDFGKTSGETFFDLVKALDQVEGIERYRISSIEPNLLTDEIIEFVSRSRRFMPHFHIPLQSGCDEVLKLMRRRYDTALFASKIKKIKEVMPDAFIGVDVIVGTRGETEAYFEQAYQFISGLDVTQLHVFSYSERPGTQALKIDYVVSPEEKHQRSQRLLALSDEKTQAFYARHIGQTMEVLMEKSKAGTPMHGFTANYIRVEVENDESLDNQMINVRLGEFNEEMTALKGTILMNDEV